MERIYTYLAAIVSCNLFCFQKVVGIPAQSPNANTILIILIGLSKFNMASRCALCQTPSAADADLDARYRSFYAPMRKGLESLSPYKHEWRDV